MQIRRDLVNEYQSVCFERNVVKLGVAIAHLARKDHIRSSLDAHKKGATKPNLDACKARAIANEDLMLQLEPTSARF